MQKNKRFTYKKGGNGMKGFLVKDGFMGLVNGIYMLFASEDDYLEYLRE